MTKKEAAKELVQHICITEDKILCTLKRNSNSMQYSELQREVGLGNVSGDSHFKISLDNLKSHDLINDVGINVSLSKRSVQLFTIIPKKHFLSLYSYIIKNQDIIPKDIGLYRRIWNWAISSIWKFIVSLSIISGIVVAIIEVYKFYYPKGHQP